MKNQKTCLDCLYCKVSAKSTANCRLCFCSLKDVQKRHKEPYWLAKTPCEDFEDMTDNRPVSRILFPAKKRLPLLNARTNRN